MKKGNEAEVNLMANSPLMSTMNMYLSNPALMGGDGSKSIRIGTHRAILKTTSEDFYDDNGNTTKINVYEIQLPLTQSLLTIKARAFATEQDAIAFVNKLEVEKIKTILGE